MRVKTYLAVMLISISVKAKMKSQDSKLLSLHLGDYISSTLKFKESALAPLKVKGQIRMEGLQYLTPISESPQLTFSELLSARLSFMKELSWFDFSADISGGTFFSHRQSHFVVHEFFGATHNEGPTKLFLGRKIQDWSELDRRWHLGLWQPKFAMDALRPEEQGLSGLFLDYKARGWQFLGFATPLFIPSVGPDIREEGGGLVADSRWYRAPSRDYDFNNRINNINYSLDIPEVAKLVAHGGVSFMGRWGKKNTVGPWISCSAGYLPVNELLLKRKNFKDVSADKVDVTVSPEVTYHGVYASDFGYSFANVNVSLSYLQDDPKEKLPENDWSIQKLESAKAYSAAVDFSLADFFSKSFAVQFEYLRVNGGGIQDINSKGMPDDFTLFDQRFIFSNALSFRAEGQLTSIYRRPLVTRFKYLYDYDQRGSLLNAEFLYYPNQKWAVLMGGDVLGVQNESYRVSSFLNQFRANDRVYGGMTYVF